MLLGVEKPKKIQLSLTISRSRLAVLTASCATRAVTLVRGTPFSWAFQATWLAHFLTLPLLVAIYTLFLVVLPVWDTVKASKVSPAPTQRTCGPVNMRDIMHDQAPRSWLANHKNLSTNISSQ